MSGGASGNATQPRNFLGDTRGDVACGAWLATLEKKVSIDTFDL